MFFIGALVDEEIEGLVHHFLGAGGGAVDLVDHDDGFMAFFQCLAQYKTSLRHGAFHCIHQEEHAINHVHDAFHFTTEIGMAGRIDDIDGDAVVLDAGILGKDGDATLSLQVIGIEHAFGKLLVLMEDVGLAQHAIDQGRLAVVDMGNDGDVADICSGFRHLIYNTMFGEGD